MNFFFKRNRVRNTINFDENLSQESQSFHQKANDSKNIYCSQKIRNIVSHESFSISMALLTVYSIFAIDIEKSSFDLQSAYIFGVAHIVAISFFVIEIMLHIISLKDYRLSFYFWIDIISTISMTLEIIWIQNFITDNSNLPAVLTIAKVIKASRLSKIGGRAVRLIKLIFQFLKTRKEEIEKQKISQQKINETNINESIGQKEQHYQEQCFQNLNQIDKSNFELKQHFKQNNIRKQELDPISEEKMTEKQSQNSQIQYESNKMTLNQTATKIENISKITLLQSKKISKMRSDSRYSIKKDHRHQSHQVSNIIQRMDRYIILPPLVRKNVDPIASEQIERKWKQLCDKQAENKKKQKQKINLSKQNFLIGQILKQKIQKNIIIMIMSLILCLPLISSSTWMNKDPSIDMLNDSYMNLVLSMNSSQEQRQFLSTYINTARKISSPLVYLFLQTKTDYFEYPGNFSEIASPEVQLDSLMQTQKIMAVGANFSLIFSNRNYNQLNSIVSIIRSLFITFLLIFSTILFMYLIQKNALLPLEQMCIAINRISVNPFDALKESNQKKNSQNGNEGIQVELETTVLQKAIQKMTNILIVGAGQIGTELILTKINQKKPQEDQLFTAQKIYGLFMYIKISQSSSLIAKDKSNLIQIINLVSHEVHEITVQNGGIPIQNDGNGFLLCWKIQDYNIIFENFTFLDRNRDGAKIKQMNKKFEIERCIELALRAYLKINISLAEFSKAQNSVIQLSLEQHQQSQFCFLRAGVHIGFGYQGSMGTSLKIQSKCIGTDINFTKRLCELATFYNTSNIISEDVINYLSNIQPNNSQFNQIRKVDYIKFKNNPDCYWIHTFDFTLLPLNNPEKKIHKIQKIQKDWKISRKGLNKQQIYQRRAVIMQQIKNLPLNEIIKISQQQKICQKMFSKEFYQTWNEAIQKYYGHDWNQALLLFENMNQFYRLNFKDPISVVMIRRISQQANCSLQNWKKYYELNIQYQI